MANPSIFAAFERAYQHIVSMLGGKADVNHNHDDVYYTESEIDTKVSTLNTAINGKAPSSHTHSIDNVTNLQSTLDAKAAQASLDTHTSNTTVHITADERTAWSNKMDNNNPTGTGSLSLNRKADTTVGAVSVAMGSNTTASGAVSTAFGQDTIASGNVAMAIGLSTQASGNCSYAEGSSTKATGDVAHAEGVGTTASANAAHAEGNNTTASGMFSHAEGAGTIASGIFSHAEGNVSLAIGAVSHAEGRGTKAASEAQHAQGKFNVEDANNTYAHIVGNGTSEDARSNIHTIDWDGNAWYQGDIYIGSTSGTNKDDGSKKLATEEYVDEAVASIQIPNNTLTLTNLSCTLPASNDWYDIAGGNGKIVIVSRYGHAAVCDDGEWRLESSLPTNYPWSTVVYGDGKFIALCSTMSTKAMYSTDGFNWSDCSSLPHNGYWDSAIYANGMFVAPEGYKSGKVAYSYDGISWSSSTTPEVMGWSDIAYGNNTFVIVADSNPSEAGSSSAAYSTDGINWQMTSMPCVATWNSVVYGNGIFVAVGYNLSDFSRKIAISRDGVAWTEQNNHEMMYGAQIAYGNGIFVLKSGIDIKYSTDAINWSNANYDGDISGNSIAYINNMFVIFNKEIDKIAYSADGATWYDSPAFISVGGQDGNSVIESLISEHTDDALAPFDKVTLLKNKTASLPISSDWRSVTYSGDKFVAVAYSSDKAAYSTDGVTWDSATLPNSADWSSVTYGNDKFVALSYNSNVAAYSTDGANWNGTTLPSSAYWNSAAYGNGVFVAIAYNSNIAAYSTDGISWISATLPGNLKWSSVTYGNGKFVAVADDNNKYAYSTDGVEWSAGYLSSANGARSITYGNDRFVAIEESAGYAYYSISGNSNSWTSKSMGTKLTAGTCITYGDGKFVFVTNNSYGNNPGSTAAYSVDGITWNSTILPSKASWKSVTYGSGKFVAVASNSTTVAISTDGINWTDSVDYISDLEGTDITEDIKSLVVPTGLATEEYVDEAVANHIQDVAHGGTGATTAEAARANLGAVSKTSLTLPLPAASWTSNSITVTATGATADNTIFVAPAPASQADYTAAGVMCTAQATNSLTFTCTSVPTADLSVNIVIFD